MVVFNYRACKYKIVADCLIPSAQAHYYFVDADKWTLGAVRIAGVRIRIYLTKSIL